MSDKSGVNNALEVKSLFTPGHTAAWELLLGYNFPWEALPHIGEFILNYGASLDETEYERCDNNVWIHRTAKVAPTAYIGGTVIIGAGTEVRHCAYIRENALVGEGAVIGNSTELKNVILFDRAQAPHYNYIGDSILGYKSHMGAGSITSNLKNDHTPVSVLFGNMRLDTKLRKFGAVLGDNAEVGCNSVLNPGCVIGANVSVYPLSSVRGYVPPNSIYKRQGEVVVKNLNL